MEAITWRVLEELVKNIVYPVLAGTFGGDTVLLQSNVGTSVGCRVLVRDWKPNRIPETSKRTGAKEGQVTRKNRLILVHYYGIEACND